VPKYCSYSSTTVTTVSTTSSAAADPGWTVCAGEGKVCSFSGTRQVRYGANGVYATKTATGSIACTNAVFGDPISNVVKSCSYKQ
jgi:hypothetical protein